ncbi:hypothetical protein [Saccharopolyspora pogona]|uniref:hypothetical protein n=1 Tax=Saccharopolyspora pogona TaxID=333966 RepID=UPI0016864659|nr:hypothetical protein [Saccharopolyspora pogona]
MNAHPTHRALKDAPEQIVQPCSSVSLWSACCRGEMPAEALLRRDREDLVWQLHQRGWTDTEIATHCRMTTYTTGRILDRLGLEPNEHRRSADAAA